MHVQARAAEALRSLEGAVGEAGGEAAGEAKPVAEGASGAEEADRAPMEGSEAVPTG